MLENILMVLQDNLTQIVITILTGILSCVGLKIKSLYEKYINDKTTKSIVEATVKYVEQIGKELDSKTKFETAKEKALEWLNDKGIMISDVELEILIESFVNSLGGA